jgi:hypothetical protein
MGLHTHSGEAAPIQKLDEPLIIEEWKRFVREFGAPDTEENFDMFMAGATAALRTQLKELEGITWKKK